MAFRDLREFIAELEKRGELKRIKVPVSPELEITEITDRVSKAYGPALLFENVSGYDVPVLMNAFGSYERMKLALGVDRLDDIGEEFLSLLNPDDIPVTMFEKLKMLPKLARLSNFAPKIVKSGPVKEVIIKDNPDLNKFPILKCWPQDGGRFITLPLVITKDPETGRRNVGMYRMQIYDGRTTGMHWHMHKDAAHFYQKAKRLGKPLEVAVALGGDPATIYAATAPLPPSIDEFLFAGFIRKEPVELVKAETVDLEVPAHAEIVIEGYVDPDELRLEGPFGDHTGYYSLTDYYPVFHVTAITHRKNPIYPATIVGKPPMEDCYMAKATERIFLPFLKLLLPEIVDINLPLEGVFHNCAIVSIRKRYPGHARKVMNALWGLGQMMFTKMIIVVDENVNVQNLSEVMWKVFNNIDAKRDLMIVEGPLDILDHASPLPNYGSKLGIDATKKWPSEGHTRPWPDDIEMDPEIKALVDRKWSDLGLD
ncbi:menaquinone biosynthesis decarboxylase [Carboxydothermus ferrireducens]|uniref:4-hydroxy-3-polyprenylbenzoate decarboxylase n=1 Tax=Carboxydothermus ferrireducens DSM 11255 TaxID=1119529 RepID=A0ABX2REU1_9THEO|nr:menaquinone biosynthesis decarboxylase [Carboxydothermus ferrireducens]NYE58558.1 4-hydroxy-3-polyprenylbenzoate decarboxylase [Carboxydothermus ferrireducens DSM 11255]